MVVTNAIFLVLILATSLSLIKHAREIYANHTILGSIICLYVIYIIAYINTTYCLIKKRKRDAVLSPVHLFIMKLPGIAYLGFCVVFFIMIFTGLTSGGLLPFTLLTGALLAYVAYLVLNVLILLLAPSNENEQTPPKF